MRNLDKYKGVIPAFYACYDENGEISPEKVRELTKYHIEKGEGCLCKWFFWRMYLPKC